MQLVAYGAQDIYITGNPQITFWKVVYRRHTNFARESIQQTLNGTAAFGNRVTATVSRNGDLLHRCYLKLAASEAMETTNAFLWLKNVEVQIGGQQIDRHHALWMYTWCDLTHSADKRRALDTMSNEASTGAAYVPLQFWFCRNPGLALPLIALQYHEVKFIIEFESGANIDNTPGTLSTAELWCDYIYLDTDERRRFAQVSHEYLIEQVQSSQAHAISNGSSATIDLTLNHPVKALYMIPYDQSATGTTRFDQVAADSLGGVQLKLNGHDRMSVRDYAYFADVQRYEHHNGYGVVFGTGKMAAPTAGTPEGVNVGVYSFALEPEEHQPSGTCNFSRIDTAQLLVGQGTATSLNAATTELDIYAVNYNVLRIMSGMGGLAYSN